jgi:hypothetical protein
LSQGIYLLFIKKKERKKALFIREKTPKHSNAFIQTTCVFDTFWLLCIYKLIARSILTAKKRTSTLGVNLVFYFQYHISLKTTEKSTKTFQAKR